MPGGRELGWDDTRGKENDQDQDDGHNDADDDDHLGILPPVLACHLL